MSVTRTKTIPWRDIKRDVVDQAMSDQTKQSLKSAMEDSLALGQLRDAVELKQTDVAERLGISQGNVSRLERREDLYLSTLREYVEALGGELDLVARFPDGMTVRLDPAASQRDEWTRAEG